MTRVALALLLVAASALEARTVTEPTAYAGWPNCLRLTNGTVELIATTDIGPRIIRYGLVGGENEFYEFPAERGLVGGEAWRPYGGHRLWHAPEIPGRTYVPDNGPIEAAVGEGSLTLTQPTEAPTGIQKQIEVTLDAEGSHVRLVHRLTNRGPWAVELAPWSLSMMNQGGFAVIPCEPYGSHQQNLLPARPMVLWKYTNLADPRWTWGERVILLRQDPAEASPQKAGFGSTLGWLAYARAGHLFVKRYAVVAGATYPDLGSTCEVFTNEAMLECETLGPLTRLEPGAAVEHVEEWWLFECAVEDNEASVVERALPVIEGTAG